MTVSRKKRLDVVILERGLALSRQQAKGLVMAGRVYVDSKKIEKPGFLVDSSSDIRIMEHALPYASRGGFKLEKAVQKFSINLDGLVVADIGASTGGFTDCMLKKGARKVYAVDVGYGQLAWPLRQDPRVVVLERTNARYLTQEKLGETVDLVTVDVSFISLTKLLSSIHGILREGGKAVALVKPQFEAGKFRVGKKGVVRDPFVHKEVLKGLIAAALEKGFAIQDLTYSPLKGPKGNIEFFIYMLKNGVVSSDMPVSLQSKIENTVMEAHQEL